MGKICGIDLGTTNSIIGSGNVLYSGLVSSSVDSINKTQVDRSVTGKHIVSSYKTNMSTSQHGEIPIVCSAIILSDLVERAIAATGEVINDIVVSVPAKFSHAQRQAVWEAAEMAGLKIHGLLNEPTAAAIYTCKKRKDLVVVYDLGGGTFDVTILESRGGDYFVIATDGNGKLAGDNFDEAILERCCADSKIKIRYKTLENLQILRNRIRDAKEEMQRTGNSTFITLKEFCVSNSWEFTMDTYIEIMKQTFQSTITLTEKLIQMYLMPTDEPKVVFVGGSTACPYLRDWVSNEINLEEIPSDCPPDLIVAKGIALYAEMMESGTAYDEVSDVTKCLSIGRDDGSVEVLIEKNSTVPISGVKIFTNSEETRFLNVHLYQGDSLVAKENEFIGMLVYDYGTIRKPKEGVVEVEVIVDHNGLISLLCTDTLTNDEQKITLTVR